MAKILTPEDFAKLVAQERGRDLDACSAQAGLATAEVNPLLSEADKKRDTAALHREELNSSKEILSSPHSVYTAALRVPQYAIGDNTLSPRGMAAVLKSGLVPDSLLPQKEGNPLSRTQALEILHQGDDQAQALATAFSNMMNEAGKSLSRPAKEGRNASQQQDQIIGEICHTIAPPPATPSRAQSHEPLKLNIGK